MALRVLCHPPPFLGPDDSRPHFSFTRELQKLVQPYLRQWAGHHRSVDAGVLYRSRVNLGLQLTSVENHFVLMQTVKAQLLQASVDESVRKAWACKENHEASMSRRLKVSKLNRQTQSQSRSREFQSFALGPRKASTRLKRQRLLRMKKLVQHGPINRVCGPNGARE